jgi:hypothetical protein
LHALADWGNVMRQRLWSSLMKKPVVSILALATLAAFAATAIPAKAESCYDLWYARNVIFAENGYCFTSQLGKQTFSNYECWTSNPKLTRAEQREIAAIKAEEKSRRCKVNN